jgi:hypothetical protein
MSLPIAPSPAWQRDQLTWSPVTILVAPGFPTRARRRHTQAVGSGRQRLPAILTSSCSEGGHPVPANERAEPCRGSLPEREPEQVDIY